jgi:16S rRNA (cytidine1402-2'-O)-methyltransferase
MSTLYIVGTPIGNLGDITLRALETLRTVDAIYAEDTRVTRKLLDRYEIKKPLLSFREAAEPRQVQKTIAQVVSALEEGKDLAYVSDAGTPGVSDPGSYLVNQVVAAGFTVIPIPGPSALASLISAAGMPMARPLFVGFLPKKKGHQTLMHKLRDGLHSQVMDAVVFYESPERICGLLREISEWEMPLQACVGREMTKQFEEMIRGSVEEVLSNLAARKQVKGEISLIICLPS